ncbi:hypothetical protein DFJ43DRAFT_1203168, partial [Lentinula guzmanii]
VISYSLIIHGSQSIFFTEAFDVGSTFTKKTSQKRSKYCSKACDFCHMKKRKCQFPDSSSKSCLLCARSGRKSCTYDRQYLYYRADRSALNVPRKEGGATDALSVLRIKEDPYELRFLVGEQMQPPSFLGDHHQSEPRFYQNNSYANRVSIMTENRMLSPPVPYGPYCPQLQLPPILPMSHYGTIGQSMPQPHFSLPPIRLLIAELESAKHL